MEVLLYAEIFHLDLGKQNLKDAGHEKIREFYYWLDLWAGRINKRSTTSNTYQILEDDQRLEVKVMQLFGNLPVHATVIFFINFFIILNQSIN